MAGETEPPGRPPALRVVIVLYIAGSVPAKERKGATTTKQAPLFKEEARAVAARGLFRLVARKRRPRRGGVRSAPENVLRFFRSQREEVRVLDKVPVGVAAVHVHASRDQPRSVLVPPDGQP
eukprot:7336489-Pyramimonas_sp.AAC.2